MRGIVPVISGLLLAAALLAQSAGISPQTTRMLTAVSEMGRSTIAPTGLAGSLTFEQSDDPTIAAHPLPRTSLYVPRARPLKRPSTWRGRNSTRRP